MLWDFKRFCSAHWGRKEKQTFLSCGAHIFLQEIRQYREEDRTSSLVLSRCWHALCLTQWGAFYLLPGPSRSNTEGNNLTLSFFFSFPVCFSLLYFPCLKEYLPHIRLQGIFVEWVNKIFNLKQFLHLTDCKEENLPRGIFFFLLIISCLKISHPLLIALVLNLNYY